MRNRTDADRRLVAVRVAPPMRLDKKDAKQGLSQMSKIVCGSLFCKEKSGLCVSNYTKPLKDMSTKTLLYEISPSSMSLFAKMLLIVV